ncbi:hypothetical protein N7451_005112 [Penicillium sp. IBT 35674x]|nr:hypothetical protein N7451_005112 [Penicillium sp. IBT 35674x]
MHKPDEEFINQFRERFGDLLLSFHGERRMKIAHVDARDPVLPVSYPKENELTDGIWMNEANDGRTLRLESGSIEHHNLNASDWFSPMVSTIKHETFDDFNLLGSGAVFHNKAGDLHSPMVRWNSNVSPLFDESVQCVPQISWNGSDCFTPLAESQRWLWDNPCFGQADDMSRTLVHRDSGYATLDGADQRTLTDGLSEQSDLKFDLARSEAYVNEPRPYSDKEKYAYSMKTVIFRYHVTLQAPTAILWDTNDNPVTYLNKGQTYTLIVADSAPPPKKVGLLEYRTFVHVSFEGEDQRSNPVECWQLWKEGRGLKEARERNGKVLAVEYVDPFQGDGRNQGFHQIRLEEAFVDGFCVTWTADSSTNFYEAAIPLKFNFLSTDFSRSKGVKGVPVRLCAKTELLRSVDDMKTFVDEPEMCYCVVKLFRDHGAERKSMNDKTYVTKRIEKLKKQIINRGPSAHFDKTNPDDCLTNGEQFDIRHQKKRKRSMSSHKSPMSDRDLHNQLAAMTDVLSSARPVSGFCLRGNKNDDPDLYPTCSSSSFSTAGVLGNQDMHGLNPTSEIAAQLLAQANPQSDLHAPGYQERPPKMPKVSIKASPVCSPPAKHSSEPIACFYVQFAQNGEKPQDKHYAIYLTARTSLNLKAKLAEKLQIDLNLISRILWVNNKGLKVVVDDDMVQHLPEAQSMVADICEFSSTEKGSSSAKCSEVEVKLVF